MDVNWSRHLGRQLEENPKITRLCFILFCIKFVLLNGSSSDVICPCRFWAMPCVSKKVYLLFIGRLGFKPKNSQVATVETLLEAPNPICSRMLYSG